MSPLAHMATGAGPHLELLLVGIGLVVMGLTFAVQRTAELAVTVLMAVAGLGLVAGSFVA